MKRIWLIIAVPVFALIGTLLFLQHLDNRADSASSQQEASSALRSLQASNDGLRVKKDKLEAEIVDTETDTVRLEYGDATAKLYEKCRLDPPKLAANRKRCDVLIAKVNAREAKEKATQEAAEKKW